MRRNTRCVVVILSCISLTIIVKLFVFCPLKAVPDHVSEGTLNWFCCCYHMQSHLSLYCPFCSKYIYRYLIRHSSFLFPLFLVSSELTRGVTIGFCGFVSSALYFVYFCLRMCARRVQTIHYIYVSKKDWNNLVFVRLITGFSIMWSLPISSETEATSAPSWIPCASSHDFFSELSKLSCRVQAVTTSSLWRHFSQSWTGS